MNRNKVEEYWRNVLRQEKLESLRKDLVTLQSQHEREVGENDAVRSRLEQGFETAEDQHRSAYAVHFQRIDELVELYGERLLHMEQNFTEKLELLQHEYCSEREVAIEQHKHKKEVLQNQISELKAEEEKLRLRDERERHQSIEEVKGRNMEELSSLRFVLDGKIEDLAKQYEAAEMDYLSKTDHKAVDFANLSAKDLKMKREIEGLLRRIDKLQGAVKRVQAVSRRNQQQRAEKNQVLAEKKSKALERYQHIKSEMDQNRESQHNHTARLTAHANHCKDDLQNKHDMAERILLLLRAASKLKAGECDAKNDGQQETDNACSNADINASDVDLVDEATKKHSIALLDLQVQDDQLRKVRKENLALKAKLRRFEDGTSLNDDVVRKDNPLFVVNGRLV